MLPELASKLVSASVGVLAQDIFLGIIPDKPDLCVALYEFSSLSPMETLGNMNETLERPGVQVLVRGARNDYPTARAKIVEVRDVLTNITDETILGVRFLRVSADSSINAIGVDANERPKFTLTLSVVMER
jgi:hypothetical protein